MNIIETRFAHAVNTGQSIEAGELLIAYLEALHVEFVFGIPGGAIEPLYNALARSERDGGPKPIITRHESGAAFMADGYARNSGKLGVCCATTGPGATNLITGVASAHENNIPLLAITAQTALNNFGKRAFQESSDTAINTVGMFQYCTRYNTLISHIDQFEAKLVAALNVALKYRFPVHLSVPVDVLRTKLLYRPDNIVRALDEPVRSLDCDSVNNLYVELTEAKKVVFVIGKTAEEAIPLILRAIDFFDALFVTTPDAKGLINTYHIRYRGVIGFAGHATAFETLIDPDVDTVVCIGVYMSEWSSNGWDPHALLNRRLINIDSTELGLTQAPMARLQVCGDFSSVFEHLLNLVIKSSSNIQTVETSEIRLGKKLAFRENKCELFEKGWEKKRIKPQWLVGQLPNLFPSGTKYIADTGNSMAWAIHYLNPQTRRVMERRVPDNEDEYDDRVGFGRRSVFGGLFQVTIEFASMGWAIAASIGAAMANKQKPVVCLTGDGSVLMNGQEITVAKEQGLPVAFIVFNDSFLGMVKHGQKLAKAEQVGVQLPQVNFAKLAESMGVKGIEVRTPSDFSRLIKNGFKLDGAPVLFDVHIDPEQVPPMSLRIKQLANSNLMTQN